MPEIVAISRPIWIARLAACAGRKRRLRSSATAGCADAPMMKPGTRRGWLSFWDLGICLFRRWLGARVLQLDVGDDRVIGRMTVGGRRSGANERATQIHDRSQCRSKLEGVQQRALFTGLPHNKGISIETETAEVHRADLTQHPSPPLEAGRRNSSIHSAATLVSAAGGSLTSSSHKTEEHTGSAKCQRLDSEI